MTNKKSTSKDSLGDRMKRYESSTGVNLMRRTYTVLRLDGKAFHSYTKGLTRPFDDGLMADMDASAIYLCKNIQGARLAFVQSDEITVILTDFDTHDTQAWFDYNVQKMCSISASMVTRAFNEKRLERNLTERITLDSKKPFKWAEFDSRVFQVPTKTEAANCLWWRQKDCTRNSISSVAQSMFSSKELHGVNTDKMQDMIFLKSKINWNDYAPRYKRGRVILKETYWKEPEAMTNRTIISGDPGGERTRWVMVEPPDFNKDKEFLSKLIPDNSL